MEKEMYLKLVEKNNIDQVKDKKLKNLLDHSEKVYDISIDICKSISNLIEIVRASDKISKLYKIKKLNDKEVKEVSLEILDYLYNTKAEF